VFYSGPDPHACAMGVTVVTDDSLVKAFLQDTDIPMNNYLLKGNDLLSFVVFFSSSSMIDCFSRSFKVNQQYVEAHVGMGVNKGLMLSVSGAGLGLHNRVHKLMEGIDGKMFTLRDALGRFRERLGDKATKKVVLACLCVALSKFLFYVCFVNTLIPF